MRVRAGRARAGAAVVLARDLLVFSRLYDRAHPRTGRGRGSQVTDSRPGQEKTHAGCSRELDERRQPCRAPSASRARVYADHHRDPGARDRREHRNLQRRRRRPDRSAVVPERRAARDDPRTAPGSDLSGVFAVGRILRCVSRRRRPARRLGMFQGLQTTVRNDEHVNRFFMAAAPSSLFATLDVRPLLGRLPATRTTTRNVPSGVDQSLALDDVVPRRIRRSSVARSRCRAGGSTMVGVMGPEFRSGRPVLPCGCGSRCDEKGIGRGDSAFRSSRA